MRAYECKGPLTVEVARDTQSALTFFAQMRALHICSWTRRENRHAFSNPFFETFHRSLIRRGVANGTVDLLRVSAGDQAIGYLYNFRHDGTVSSYQSGFDDVDRQLRPGYVCHALAIAHYAAAGMSSYDFLGGTNQLKQSFGPQRYELCGYRLHKKTPLFRADLLARRVVGAFRSRPIISFLNSLHVGRFHGRCRGGPELRDRMGYRGWQTPGSPCPTRPRP